MRAQVFGEGDVARLVEAADEIARLKHDAQHRCGVFRVRTQITIAQLMCGKQRRTSGKIDNEIAARDRAVAWGAEGHCAARRGRGRRIIIDGEFERAEMALRGTDRAFHNGEIGDAQRRQIFRTCDQHRHIQMLGEQFCGFDRAFVAPINQRHAFAR